MLHWLNLFGNTEREESASDTLDAAAFAQIYFSYYPYLSTNG